MRDLTIFLLVTCVAASCNFRSSQTEIDFKNNLKEMIGMFRDYEKIPTKQKPHGAGVIIWKEQDKVKKFYETHRPRFLSIDKALSQMSIAKSDDPWRDDAAFSRVVLYSFWSTVDADKEIWRKAIIVASQFLELSSSVQIEDWTKTEMQDSFFKGYQGIWTANLSFEDNVRIFIRGYLGHFFVKSERYKEGIAQYEIITATFPDSKYSELAKEHIAIIKDLESGKLTLPQSLP